MEILKKKKKKKKLYWSICTSLGEGGRATEGICRVGIKVAKWTERVYRAT